MKNISTKKRLAVAILTGTLALQACTKYGDGFISSTMQYSTKLMVVPKGQVAKSNSLVSDGSSIPLNVQLYHIHDATGKQVDEMFAKTYDVAVWTKAYDPKLDTTFDLIMAKRKIEQLPPIIVNPTSGVIEANNATLNIPDGEYSLDLKVTNSAGEQIIKNAITLDFQEQPPFITDVPAVGNFASGRASAGTAPVTYFFNGANNPFVEYSINRFADTPNVVLLQITDKNGVPFNPKTGEVIKRPQTGINPDPPYLQNLEQYSPDTYEALDTAMKVRYPVAPYPIASLGNTFMMYYNIKASAVTTDSTSNWSANTEGVKYKGTADSHYLGVYKDGRFDYSIRIPMRVQVPGSYLFTVKILNATHR